MYGFSTQIFEQSTRPAKAGKKICRVISFLLANVFGSLQKSTDVAMQLSKFIRSELSKNAL